MPLYSLSERDLRDHCKRAIEALELWVRRLIHQKLSESYGVNYLDARRSNGDRVVRKDIAVGLAARMASEPIRFPSPIDAAFLEDAVSYGFRVITSGWRFSATSGSRSGC